MALRCLSLACALALFARTAHAQPVIPPGQEPLVAAMLGAGIALPDGCTLDGASIEARRIAARYRCPQGERRLELRALEEASPSARRTAQFAVLPGERPLPPALLDALLARIAAHESRFHWVTPTNDHRAPKPRTAIVFSAALATAFAVVVVATIVLRRVRRQRAAETRAEGRVPLPYAVAGAVALPLCLGAALRWGADAAFAAWLDRGAQVVATRALGFIAFTLASTVPAFAVARASSRVAVAVALLLATLAWLGVAVFVETRAVEAPGFEGLYTYPKNAHWTDRRGRPAVVTQVETNALGFRGHAFSRARTAGVARVVLVGDSNVFGLGVDLEGTLAMQLSAALAAKWPERRIEVLNLGIPGDNLASHVTSYDVAARALAPDVVVMGVQIGNDTSRWDYQVERREASRPTPYAFARAVLGHAAAPLFDLLYLEREVTREGLAHLARQTERLRRLGRRAGAPWLLGFAYHRVTSELESTLGRLPRTTLAGSGDPVAGDSIPGDGHPTRAGNRRFAAILADAIGHEPALANLGAR